MNKLEMVICALVLVVLGVVSLQQIQLMETSNAVESIKNQLIDIDGDLHYLLKNMGK